jgi:hypothetical protein
LITVLDPIERGNINARCAILCRVSDGALLFVGLADLVGDSTILGSLTIRLGQLVGFNDCSVVMAFNLRKIIFGFKIEEGLTIRLGNLNSTLWGTSDDNLAGAMSVTSVIRWIFFL